jgi:C2H2-type zinc finger
MREVSMNAYEEDFDFLNIFGVLDSPPCMEDILASSTNNQSTNTNSKQQTQFKIDHRVLDFKPIDLIKPKPKFIFIPNPPYTTTLASVTEIPKTTTNASQDDANMMTTNTSAEGRQCLSSHASSLPDGSKSTNLNDAVMPMIEPIEDFPSTSTPLISRPKRPKPNIESTCGFMQHHTTHCDRSPPETMKHKQSQVEPIYDFGENTSWKSVPVLNMKQKIGLACGSECSTSWNIVSPTNLIKEKQLKIEPAYVLQNSNARDSVQNQNAKQKQQKLVPAYDSRYDASLKSTMPVNLTHRCTICEAAFSTPRSLGGHMSAHVKKKNRASIG